MTGSMWLWYLDRWRVLCIPGLPLCLGGERHVGVWSGGNRASAGVIVATWLALSCVTVGGAGTQLRNGYGTGTLGEDAPAHRSGVTVGARGGSGFGCMGVDGVSGVVGCTGAVGTATVRAGAAARRVGSW
jgi:hypothetical protein